jgi:hypothetical protein
MDGGLGVILSLLLQEGRVGFVTVYFSAIVLCNPPDERLACELYMPTFLTWPHLGSTLVQPALLSAYPGSRRE